MSKLCCDKQHDNISIDDYGPTGFTGYTGYTGPTGYTGYTGPTGPDPALTGFADGSEFSPSIFFTNQTNVGFYRPTTDNIGLSLGATGIVYQFLPERFRVYATEGILSDGPFRGLDGSTGTPAYQFDNPVNGLFYDTSDNSISTSVNAVKTHSINATGTYFYTNNTLTGSILSNGFGSSTQEVISVLRTTPLGTLGSSTTPTTFTSYDTPVILRGFSAPSSGIFTIPSTGVYLINVATSWGSDPNGYRRTLINRSNINGMIFTDTRIAANPSDVSYYMSTGIYIANAGDTFFIQVAQNSGSALTIDIRLTSVRMF